MTSFSMAPKLKTFESLSAGLLCVAMLTGCQTTGQNKNSDVQAVALNSQNPVLLLAAATPYTMVRLKPGNQLGLVDAMTGPRYRAASGRICKPLLDRQRIPIGQLVCNKGKNSWYVQRALSLGGKGDLTDSTSIIAASDVKALPVVSYPAAVIVDNSIKAGDAEVAKNSNNSSKKIVIKSSDRGADKAMYSAEPALMSLDEGETLWGFAQRVTGDGQNWKTIAKHNGIEDVRSMGKDRQLQVPRHLIQH